MEELMKKYKDKIVSQEEYDEIAENSDVTEIQNCGNSGLYIGETWYVVVFKNGEEMSIYG